MCPKETKTIGELGEFGIIDLFAKVGQGIGDDCAIVDAGGRERLCVSTDMLVEGVHFERSFGTAWQLGWKALAVNLSDLAAMGAKPLACLLAMGLPESLGQDWLIAFRDGLEACSRRYACPLVGGDTVRNPSGLSLSLTVLGRGLEQELVGRAGAKAGDLIHVAGPLGDSAAGLHLLQGGAVALAPADRDALIGAHVQPEPQLELGRALAAAGLASAMIDISDGFLQDLGHLARASGLGAEVLADRLPLSRAAWRLAEQTGMDARDWALGGGEDYRLLFCSPENKRTELAELLERLGVGNVVSVGSLSEGAGLRVLKDGRWIDPGRGGYDHFSAEQGPVEEEGKT